MHPEAFPRIKAIEPLRKLKEVSSTVLESLGRLSILPSNPLATHGDHLPRGAEAMLAEELQPQLPFEAEAN